MIKLKLPKINIPLSILVLVFGAVVATNFPSTWYTGWDNLHPEFNFGLNFSRALSSVWQSNQGLGTYGGHGYGATLPHTALLFLMSITLPDMLLRSTFTFICLISGAIGIYYLLRKLLYEKDSRIRDISSFIGGLFYMLNYTTVQSFYIQLEAFIVHFAALPWLFLTLIIYLEKRTLKRLLIFLIISFITSVQGFIPPLFVVYFILLSIFLLIYFLKEISINRIKTSFLILILTLLINAYWLFPVGYYASSRSETYLNSYNNISSTENFLEKNKKYGTLDNISQFKGFLSEAIDITSDGAIFTVFHEWEEHMNTKSIQIINIILFIIVLIGSIKILLKRKLDDSKFFLIGFLLSLTFLATNTFPFSQISELLQNLPIFKQAFRISFTKFSISFIFFYTILLGIGLSYILSLLILFLKGNSKKIVLFIFGLIFFISIIFTSLPVFRGNLMYHRTKIDIPSNYFALFDFFKEQDKNQRIANLPQGWNWGWSVYDWGYSGSGFLWYGIEQPILDRSFDVWGRNNENYYWEIYYAIFSQRFHLIENILDKYDVQWLVFDNNISPYLNPYEYYYVQELKKYIDSSDKFKIEKVLKSRNIKAKDIIIYKVNRNNNSSNKIKIFTQSEIKNIGPSYGYNNADYAFDDFGNYYTDDSKPFDYYYIFRSLFDNRRVSEFPLNVKEDKESITLISKIPDSFKNYALLIPPTDDNFKEFQPEIKNNGNEVSIKFNKITQDSYESDKDFYFLNHEANNCMKSKNTNSVFKQEATILKDLRFTSFDSENCYAIILDRISQRSSYLIQIESRNIKGSPLQFAVINHDSRKADIDLKLPKNQDFKTNYLFTPPMKQYGAGYTLHFQNTAIGKQESINEIKKITSYVIPYNFLSGLILANPNPEKEENRILVNSQSYDPGWSAYSVNSKNLFTEKFPFFSGKKLKNHIMVNNWANGWVLNSQTVNSQSSIVNNRVVIIYLPQYLQYAGFILTGATLILLGFVFVLDTRMVKRLGQNVKL